MMETQNSATIHQIPADLVIHRQRFYFLRHGQSANNFCSLQDEASKEPFDDELRRLPKDHQPFLQGHQRLHALSQEQENKLLQCEEQQQLTYLEHSCSQEVHQHIQLLQSSEKHQGQEPLVHKREDQRPLLQNQGRRRQQGLEKRRRLSLSPDDVPTAGMVVEKHRPVQQTGRVPDPPLTEVGRRQAAAAARWLQQHVEQMLVRPQTGRKRGRHVTQQTREQLPSPIVKKIVCSPMRRAVETAAELRKVLRADVYVHPLLFEQGGLFRGPRNIAPSIRPDTVFVTADGANNGESGVCGDSESTEWAGTYRSSQTTSTGRVVDTALPDICGDSCTPTRETRTAADAETVCNTKACEGLTLQEVETLLPGVRVIIPFSDGHAWKQHSKAHHQNGRAVAAASCSKAPSPCRTEVHEEVASDTQETRISGDNGARTMDTDECTLKAPCLHQGKAAVKEKAVGGHYCEEWTHGGCSWWCGGREKMIDTVARAAEIVSWMQSECRAAQNTGGAVLMVMHGLVMDLIVKALMFPFPSASSACPYLDLLAESLRAHEKAWGKPFYSVPQQTAYFMSSNCSFCCFELATAAQQQPGCHNSPMQRSSGVYREILTPTHVGHCTAGYTSPAADHSRPAASECRGGSLIRSSSAPLLERPSQPRQADLCIGTWEHSVAANLDIVGAATDGLCQPPKGAEDATCGATAEHISGTCVSSTTPVVELSGSPDLTVSRKEAQHHMQECGGCDRGRAAEFRPAHTPLLEDAADTVMPAAASIARCRTASLSPLLPPAPALVSALIEWNVPAVDSHLHTGQTLGSSIVMFC